MKQIYKIMVSIVILMLISSIGIAANQENNAQNGASENLTGDVSNPTSDKPVPEIEEAKLPTPAEEKARFENRMKYVPRIQENKSAQKSVVRPKESTVLPSTIPSEISYSNPVTGTSMFGTNFNSGSIYNSVTVNWKTYSFYLPVSSYVYTDISGSILWIPQGFAYYNAWMDGNFLNGDYAPQSCGYEDYNCVSSIQRSRLTYLSKGWHNLYIDGYAYPFLDDYYSATGFISIIAEPEYTAITVLSPNGGETWYRGTTKSITWKKDGQPGANVKIELYKNGVLSTVISSLTPNDGIYSWYIPTYTPIGTDYKIKISSTSEPTKYYDWSNNNFKIY